MTKATSTSAPGIPVSRRRILHVHNNADLYGASRMLLRWLKCMDRQRFEALVVIPEGGPLKTLIEAEGIEVIIHPRLSVLTRSAFRSWRLILFCLNFPLSVLFLRGLVRRRKIDLVYTNSGVVLSSALAARLAGVPHVWHIREWFQEFRGLWPMLSKYMTGFSAKVIAISTAVADQFKSRRSVIVIHDGCALEEFEVPISQLREEFRTSYRLADSFVVGCVGRIKWMRKGQEFLVQAAGLLKQRGIRIKALIIGAPFAGNEDHLRRLEQLAGTLGIEDDVVFTGELSDTRPAYAAMDVLTLTSAQPEPFGGVMTEAMAMNLPVIATNIGGPLDLVVEGETGLLIPPADPAALADAIEKLMSNPALCEQMGRNGRERLRNTFALAEMSRKIEGVIQDALLP